MVDAVMATVVLAIAAVYLLIGRGVVGAAHDANPALRKCSQISQCLAVIAWPINVYAARRRDRRHRQRL